MPLLRVGNGGRDRKAGRKSWVSPAHGVARKNSTLDRPVLIQVSPLPPLTCESSCVWIIWGK